MGSRLRSILAGRFGLRTASFCILSTAIAWIVSPLGISVVGKRRGRWHDPVDVKWSIHEQVSWSRARIAATQHWPFPAGRRSLN